jgi:hypothetical protein
VVFAIRNERRRLISRLGIVFFVIRNVPCYEIDVLLSQIGDHKIFKSFLSEGNRRYREVQRILKEFSLGEEGGNKD